MRDFGVCVAGIGKLGACVAATLANSGLLVTGLDIDPAKVLSLANGRAPVDEPGLNEAILTATTLQASSDTEYAVRHSETCLFVTPTPSDVDGSFSNTYLIQALKSVALEVKKQNKQNYLFVIVSTVTPGSCNKVFRPLLWSILGDNYQLCYKPEFIALGSVIHDLQFPDVVLIGESSSEAGERIEKMYQKVVKGSCRFARMSLIEAELAKISLNCFLTMKISFANQVGMLASKFNANPDRVLSAIGDDHRVGKAFLKFGGPYSGPCLPRDNRCFSHVAGNCASPYFLSSASDHINSSVKQSILDRVFRAANSFSKEKKIGILGTAYKPGACVTDESLGIYLAKGLSDLDYEVRTHDPKAAHSNCIVSTTECPVLVIACPWDEYRNLDLTDKAVIDPWGLLNNQVQEKICVQGD